MLWNLDFTPRRIGQQIQLDTKGTYQRVTCWVCIQKDHSATGGRVDGISTAADVGRPITKASSTAVQAQGDDQGWDENGQERIHWRDVQQLREQLMAMGCRGLRGEGDKSVRNYW